MAIFWHPYAFSIMLIYILILAIFLLLGKCRFKPFVVGNMEEFLIGCNKKSIFACRWCIWWKYHGWNMEDLGVLSNGGPRLIRYNVRGLRPSISPWISCPSQRESAKFLATNFPPQSTYLFDQFQVYPMHTNVLWKGGSYKEFNFSKIVLRTNAQYTAQTLSKRSWWNECT